MIAAMTSLTGSSPTIEVLERYQGWGPEITRYQFDGIAVLSQTGTDFATVSITSATIGGSSVRTLGGIGIGSSLSDVIADGGVGEWDSDGDGDPNYYILDPVDVPGTESLTHPGQVGISFVLVRIDNDVVTEMQAPGNDFTDL